MKKERKHSVDKLFLKSLGGQQIEPSAGVWESLATHIPSAGGNGTFLFLISGIVIGAFIFFMHARLQTGPGQVAVSNPVIIEETIIVNEPNKLNDNTLIQKDEVEETVNKQTIPSQNTNASLGIASEQPLLPPDEGNIGVIVISDIQTEIQEGNQSDGITSTFMDLDKANFRSCMIDVSPSSLTLDLQERKSLVPHFELNLKDSYAKKADVLFGAAFSPAVNIYPEGQNRNDYSLEFVASYEKSRFILEGGIGANYTSESAKYRINYTSYDSVGFYMGVTSFNIDPEDPESPIFETNLKNLYDSIDHYRINENTNKFVYLQIPLRAGYRVLEMNRFSLDIKIGLLFSVQVYKDVPGIPYQGSDTENIEVIRQYPDRLTTTWQYTAGIGFNYQINNNVRFTLEPIYRQYIKSVYSPSSEFPARSPYSFGIRGGIYFHF